MFWISQIRDRMSKKEKPAKQPKGKGKKAPEKPVHTPVQPQPAQTRDDVVVQPAPQIYIVRERPRPRKKQDLNPDIVVEIFKKKDGE